MCRIWHTPQGSDPRYAPRPTLRVTANLLRVVRLMRTATAHSTSLVRGHGRGGREDPVCGEGDRVERWDSLQRALLALVVSFADCCDCPVLVTYMAYVL